MYKIAIIGSGFAGLATAWHLLEKRSDIEVVIFDPHGIGGGTSGIAAGLMHPFAGAHSKLNWMGYEGYQSTCRLLTLASHFMERPVADFNGMIRVALTSMQESDFSLAAEKYDEIVALSPEECQNWVSGVVLQKGILIKNAVTVDCGAYLQGLWKACQEKGARFEKVSIPSLEQLSGYDKVVIATGAMTALYDQIERLPITQVKGQILELECAVSPKIPLNSQAYLVAKPNSKSCVAGATYEKNFTSLDVDCAFAKQDILPKVIAFYPEAKHAKVIGCRAGVRASTPDHRPIIKQLDRRHWAFTGLGSKGLLYHSLFADKLSAILLE